MAEIVNLRQARKTRARADKGVKAAENALRFGRSKAEKQLEQARADKARADLDGKKRE
ncbi:MAG: DUF4169 family protein [Paracoccaceae bacterium]